MDTFQRILGIILPVFIVIALGFAYGRLRGATVKADMNAVNRVSMDALCPLLVFTALAGKDFELAANATLIVSVAAVPFLTAVSDCRWEFTQAEGAANARCSMAVARRSD